MRLFIISFCLTSWIAVQVSAKEYAPFNGWYNNWKNPSSASYDTPINRLVLPRYNDGVYVPSGKQRPNPRTISNNIFSGKSGIPSAHGKTALFYFFGEHLMQEIAEDEVPGCPPEYFNIAVPFGDSTFDPDNSGTISIPYQRAQYQTSNSGYSPNHPREQLNSVTSYLDGSAIYGRDKTWSDQLRLRATKCPGRSKKNILADKFHVKLCSGELTSHSDEGKLPDLNTKGLPLSNPVPPIYGTPLSARRLYHCNHGDVMYNWCIGTQYMKRHAFESLKYALIWLPTSYSLHEGNGIYLETGGRKLNENPYLFTIAVIWFRHHNWLARQLTQTHPDWSDERVFNEARTRNVATYQQIVFNEWLPVLLGDCPANATGKCLEIPSYSGYQPGTSTQISDIFEVAAKYYIRTLAPEGVFARSRYRNVSDSCEFNILTRICNTYWTPNEILKKTPIDEIIMGMSSQIAEQSDHVVNEDLRNFYHGPLHFSRRDLVSLIIQKGRDYGLPDYNTVRQELGLERKNTFQKINPELFRANNSKLLDDLITTHNGSIDNVDVFVGGMLETWNDQPGELFRYILIDQFRRLRDGDRFWFENLKNGLLNESDVLLIRNVTFRDVILRTNPGLNASVDLQDFSFIWGRSDDTKLFCPQPYQVGNASNPWETPCTKLTTYDYFSTSQVSFALIFASFGVFVILTISVMRGLVKHRQNELANTRKQMIIRHQNTQPIGKSQSATITWEVLGVDSIQQIQVVLDQTGSIIVKTGCGNRMIRKINLDASEIVELTTNKSSNLLVFRSKKTTYDLILKFDDESGFDRFFSTIKNFMSNKNVSWRTIDFASENLVLEAAKTKEKRDNYLKSCLKSTLAHSLHLALDNEKDRVSGKESKVLINTKISKEEFAEYLKVKPESSFIQQMFSVADGDEDGLVSLREFLDIVVLFTEGSLEDKMKLMFSVYDIDQSGQLSSEEFKAMLKSMMEMVSTSIDVDHLDQLVSDLMKSSGVDNKKSLKLNDFMKIMSRYSAEMSKARLVVADVPVNCVPTKNSSLQKNNKRKKSKDSFTQQKFPIYKTAKSTRYFRAQRAIKNFLKTTQEKFPLQQHHNHKVKFVPVFQEKYMTNKFKKRWIVFTKWNQHYASHIFIVTLYTCLTIGVFLQSHNVVASNHLSGFNRIGGGWPALAKASAAALIFNFSVILLTMCRNTITLLRETVLHRYIPFDSAMAMHKFIAWMGLLFTTLHVISHGVNFYSISTQTPSDLLCLFRDYWFPTDFLPTFAFWCFQTITGITGVLLTLDVVLMYVFASNYSRRIIFNWFQNTHKFGFVFLYFCCVLHGSGTFLSSPTFYLYFLGPAILYALDTLYSLSRKKMEISVVKAELLPSNVTYLELKRPPNFDYKAGQWVRIACLAQSPVEYHPFTLSSAPHETTLKLHIRAVGPWTQNLRTIYDPETLRDSPYPKIYLDGPFGEGHQDWFKYEVSVLVGGGIGVTPFASILKDLVNTTQSRSRITCKAVYFIWVTRDQKQYEWLIDIIKEVENKDKNGILNAHIFITGFLQEFNLCTTMLYICEQHFQKIAGKSLFTGLRAVTHFGRPNFLRFLASLADKHNKVKNFGVFSCGPPAMTGSVEKACSKLNQYKGASYNHHFENF